MSTAEEIVKAVGGPDNISNLTHCATRLRFELVDGSKADADKVDAIDGVMGAVPQGANHFQVIIGGAVQTVFNEINALPEMSNRKQPTDEEVKAAARAGGVRGKAAWVDSFFEFLSDSFRPVLGALLGASLFITFMSLMTTMKVIGNWADDEQAKLLSPSWQFVNLLWKSVLYFLPLMVAYNASKKVGADPWVGFAIMGVLMLPGFLALKPIPKGEEYAVVDIFGLPMTIFNYGSQVFPPLLIAALLGPLYKLLKKVIPSNIQLIFVPFFAMLIMMPLAAYLIGPAGVYMGSWLAHSLESINRLSPLILSLFIPLIYPFMVPLGLHWPINAIMLVNIRTLGYDYIEGPMGAWNFACYGATAGVFFLAWRDREKQMRQTATGALMAGLVGGISEPSLYGIHLRFKRIYPLMLGGCVLGGLIMGLGDGVTAKAFVFSSILTIPSFNQPVLYTAGIAVAFVTAMALVIVFDYRDADQRAAAKASRKGGRPAAPAAQATSTGAAEPADVDPVKVEACIVALGGRGNIASSDGVAATRLRVKVKDSSKVDATALADAGIHGAAEVAKRVWHLVVGQEAGAFAEAFVEAYTSQAAQPAPEEAAAPTA